MYAIYANIWGILMVNVTIYGIHTDPMGLEVSEVIGLPAYHPFLGAVFHEINHPASDYWANAPWLWNPPHLPNKNRRNVRCQKRLHWTRQAHRRRETRWASAAKEPTSWASERPGGFPWWNHGIFGIMGPSHTGFFSWKIPENLKWVRTGCTPMNMETFISFLISIL